MSKTFTFQNKGDKLPVQVSERLEPSYGLYTWPSSVVLAQYVWHHRKILVDKNILELGAGTGLPGIVALLSGKTKSVTLTDDSRQPKCLHNLASSCLCNGISTDETKLNGFHCRQTVHHGVMLRITGLTWGEVPPIFDDHITDGIPYPDIILGSDCLFDETIFESVFFTIHYLLDRASAVALDQVRFLCTYQVRSSRISLDYYIRQWGLKYREIPLNDFCQDQYDIAKSGMPGNHKIKMLEIALDGGSEA